MVLTMQWCTHGYSAGSRSRAAAGLVPTTWKVDYNLVYTRSLDTLQHPALLGSAGRVVEEDNRLPVPRAQVNVHALRVLGSDPEGITYS